MRHSIKYNIFIDLSTDNIEHYINTKTKLNTGLNKINRQISFGIEHQIRARGLLRRDLYQNREVLLLSLCNVNFLSFPRIFLLALKKVEAMESPWPDRFTSSEREVKELSSSMTKRGRVRFIGVVEEDE